MYRRAYALLIGMALLMGALALGVSLQTGRPLVDPEGFLGPAWVRMPVMVAAAVLIDLVPRALWRARGRWGETKVLFVERWREHWTRERITLVALGIVCFYFVYVCYRNLKNFMPFVLGQEINGEQVPTLYDWELHLVDKAIMFGQDPAVVLHAIFGQNVVTAHLLSYNYILFIPLVATLVAVWLVWSRNISYGYWFVTSQVMIWALGTLTYYALPTLGPGIAHVSAYADLPSTPVTQLMDSLVNGRQQALFVSNTDSVNGVAGFASLHTGVSMLWALMAQYTVRSKVIRWIFWFNFVMTVIATLYFGWHYIADDVAGITIALISFYVGAKVTGQKFDRHGSHPTILGSGPRPRPGQPAERSDDPTPAEPALAEGTSDRPEGADRPEGPPGDDRSDRVLDRGHRPTAADTTA